MRSKGVLHIDTQILVPFFDVDTMHVVWHGHYIKYLEVARCALLGGGACQGRVRVCQSSSPKACGALQCGHKVRTSRWAMTPSTVALIR